MDKNKPSRYINLGMRSDSNTVEKFLRNKCDELSEKLKIAEQENADLKSNVITPLEIVSVCRYRERDMNTFKSVSLLPWINSDFQGLNFEG